MSRQPRQHEIDAYLSGFEKACAEYGVDMDAMVKLAQLPPDPGKSIPPPAPTPPSSGVVSGRAAEGKARQKTSDPNEGVGFWQRVFGLGGGQDYGALGPKGSLKGYDEKQKQDIAYNAARAAELDPYTWHGSSGDYWGFAGADPSQFKYTTDAERRGAINALTFGTMGRSALVPFRTVGEIGKGLVAGVGREIGGQITGMQGGGSGVPIYAPAGAVANVAPMQPANGGFQISRGPATAFSGPATSGGYYGNTFYNTPAGNPLYSGYEFDPRRQYQGFFSNVGDRPGYSGYVL